MSEVMKEKREFAFTAADFETVRKLIYEHAGISLAPVKSDMVYSRLARRLRALDLTDFQSYLAVLQADDGPEWETFVNSLTTNLTSFFREAHHFEILTKFLQEQKQRPVRIWCSAASTGEEPYTLAMTACEAFNTLSPPVEIIASDIDTNVLATAARGVYAMDRVNKLSPTRLKSFFLKGTGTQAGHARIRPELQRLVTFTRINLLEKIDLTGPFDVMFCRNVMIYFDKPTQHAILKKFSPLLRPDGLLFAGHSESFLHAADVFRSLGRTVYERTDSPLAGKRQYR
jgi:chemotaxis protein methyltransferase CheR